MKKTLLTLAVLTLLPISLEAETRLVKIVDTTCRSWFLINGRDTLVCEVDTVDAWAIITKSPTRVDTLPKIIVYVHDTVFVPAKTPCDHAWEWEYQYGFGGSATGWINEVYLCRDHYNLIGNSRCIYCGETRRRK